MRSSTIIYPERGNVYGDKDTHVFYSISPVMDRLMVISFKGSIATIKPMYKSTTANMLSIAAGCFEDKSNVSIELFKVYEKETKLDAIRVVLNNATVLVTRSNAKNLLLNYGKEISNEKCEQEMVGNATTCGILTNNAG